MNASAETIVGSDSIAVLDLNLRIMNRLGSEGIFRVRDLCVCRASDLMKLPGFGTKSLRDVEAALHRAGHSLRAEE